MALNHLGLCALRFAHQPSGYRSYWLGYAAGWLASNDPQGHFEMPFLRNLCDRKFPGGARPPETVNLMTLSLHLC